MDKSQLKSLWVNLTLPISDYQTLNHWWGVLVRKYSQKRRAYHNLTHIGDMMTLCEKHKDSLKDPEILAFSIFFHDLIYSPTSKDNELRSALKATEFLTDNEVEEERIAICYHQILLTRTHQGEHLHQDAQFLIDFDLAVLGREWAAYELYTRQIRKEYWMYPGPMYRKGRKAVLQQFLTRDRIFHTAHFHELLEERARLNIQQEIDRL
ncbi:MAG: hypothetical protein AAF824_24460 [Bacteroidota bacterium]